MYPYLVFRIIEIFLSSTALVVAMLDIFNNVYQKVLDWQDSPSILLFSLEEMPLYRNFIHPQDYKTH